MLGLWVHSDALDEGPSLGSSAESSVLYPANVASKHDISILAGKHQTDFRYHRSGHGKEGIPVLIRERIDSRSGEVIPAHYVECGDFLRAVGCSFSQCESRKSPKIVPHQCGGLGCPVCFRAAAGEKARRADDRHVGLFDVYESLGIHLGNEKHIAFSPAQDGNGTVWLGPLKNRDGKDISSRRRKWTKAELVADGGATLLREYRKLLKESFRDGVFAGTSVFHMERKKHFASAPHHVNPLTGLMVICYDDDCQLPHDVYDDWLSCEDDDCELPHRWFYGPHVHFDGYGFVEDSLSFSSRTGWIYHNIPSKSGRSTFATIRYLLTHSALFERVDELGKVHRKQAYSYVGLFSAHRSGFFEDRRDKRPASCELCGSPVRQYGLTDDSLPDYSNDQGQQEELVVCGRYYVRIKGNVMPSYMAKDVEERALHRSELVAMRKESKASVWGKEGLILGDGKLLEGFRDPDIVLWRSMPPSHRHRYRPHPFVGVK